MDSWKAPGGVARLYGHWAWPGEIDVPTGSLVFKVENRHRLGTDIAPQQLGGEVGYSGLTAITWSDADWLLSNFYWHQSLFDNRFEFAAGVVDTTDYVDMYGLVNPWTFLSAGPTIMTGLTPLFFKHRSL